MKNLDYHEHPISSKKFLNDVKLKDDEIVIVTNNQFTPEPFNAKRIIFFAGNYKKIRFIYDCWITETGYNEIIKKLSENHEIYEGENDAMYATSPHYFWYSTGSNFYIYEALEIHAVFFKSESIIYNSKKEKILIDVDKIKSVEAYLSEDWTHRKLVLNDFEGNEFIIAFKEDLISLIDPCYDKINILFEAKWLKSLGKPLAAFLEKEIKIDEDLEWD